MKLSHLLTEKFNELDFHDEETLELLKDVASKIEKLGYKRTPFTDDLGVTPTDGNDEVLLHFSNSIFGILIYIAETKDNKNSDPYYRTYLSSYIVKDYVFGEKDNLELVIFDSYDHDHQNEDSLQAVREMLTKFVDTLPRLSEIMDWYFDVSGEHGKVKIMLPLGLGFAKRDKREYPPTLDAIAGRLTLK